MLNLFAIATLPIILTSSAYSKSESFVQTNGGNSSVYNEVTVSTNGEEIKVISNEAGSISVKSENGKYSITKSPQINPTIINKNINLEITTAPVTIKNDTINSSKELGENINKTDNFIPRKVLAFFKKIVLKWSLLIGNIYKR